MKKLVRDNIPEIIKEKWDNCEFYIAETLEHIEFLVKKLLEESQEVEKAKTDNEIMDEIWDLKDVIDKLCELKWLNQSEIDLRRKNKTNIRWWFDKWIILTKY